jgi:hypothetical protein
MCILMISDLLYRNLATVLKMLRKLSVTFEWYFVRNS